MITKPEILTLLLTVVVGTTGAALAAIAGIPAPFLSGPALAVTMCGLFGLKLDIPKRVRDACFVLVGISMGTSVTPEIFHAAKSWPLSFVAVVVTVVLLLYCGYWLLHYVFRYDRTTAMLAASPGHLSYIISLSAETRSDLASISIIQSVRVLALTLSVPLIVEYFDLVSTDISAPAAAMNPVVLVVTFACALLLGMLFIRWRFPAALLLGGMVVSVATHITGFTAGAVPPWAIQPTYILIGCLIGLRFYNVSIGELKRAFIAGGVLTIVVVGIAGAIALTISNLTGVPLNAVMIAFAPGGLETMAAMAIMMHADATYVGSHHILRLLFLSFLMPAVLKRTSGLEDKDADK
ncbi:membrane AbrB-like protein [Rhizobium sp. BIGb0125]|uniref:AbrB family transcriptional regulator n=1 Tax=Rhizobium sp. BIGb0125 TaxID=2940618 RepID=UPI00216A14E5|nr:AbrB family transcriptional regulator [Rhizobium sp. BIGb0125]MCS4243602.1 membrane AbrB-like protein [Rhizobium sp. BIGb0125]